MINRLIKRFSHSTFAAIVLSGSISMSACTFGGQAATALPTVLATESSSAVAITAVPTLAKALVAPTTVHSEIPSSASQTAVSKTVAPANTDSSAAIASTVGSPRVLAWSKDAKQLAWYSATGNQTVLSGAATATMACGANPIWPAADKLIVYHGNNNAPAQLISLSDPAAAPTAIGDSSAVGCDLGGRTAFSPDKKRLALISFTADSTTVATYAIGKFRIVNVADGTEQTSIDGVNAFSLENNGALLIHLIPNSKNIADQADIGWWDATTNKERFLERSVKATDKCFFVNASVVHVADKVYTSFGENCTPPAPAGYRILRTDFAGGNSSNWVQHTATSGNYFNNSATNYLTVLPDNQTLLLAVANGLKARIANLLRVNIADATITPLMQSVVMDSSPQSGPHRYLFNPQRTLLAFVVANTNNGETLYVYDLSKPTQAPAPITDGTRSNQLTGLVWNAAGDRVIYTVTGDDASLGYFDLTAGKNLVVRGIFQGLALSADGLTAATTEQIKVAATDLRYNVVTVALADGTKTVLVTGDKGVSPLEVLALR